LRFLKYVIGCRGIKLNELFTLDDNIKGTIEAILGNLLNFGVYGTAVSIFTARAMLALQALY